MRMCKKETIELVSDLITNKSARKSEKERERERERERVRGPLPVPSPPSPLDNNSILSLDTKHAVTEGDSGKE